MPYSFANDYSEGAHPLILERLAATNLDQTDVYLDDVYCQSAAALIKNACACPTAHVHFFIGGTQTNATIISALLRPHQGVFSTDQGHINTHEAGAIEHGGHKVLMLPTADGKLTAEQIAAAYKLYLADSKRAHWVQPKMVYVSQPTELGTLYSKKELTELAEVCWYYGLYLYVDGARLGYALSSPANDLSLTDLAALTDAFYIGGTKCGLLFGEAAVIVNPALAEDFHSIMKQNGAVLAKSRLLGLQFEALFTDGLYEKICGHGIAKALQIKDAFRANGFSLLTDSFTNQQFPILKNTLLAKLRQEFVIGTWEVLAGDTTAVRFCTSWATRDEEVEKLITLLRQN